MADGDVREHVERLASTDNTKCAACGRPTKRPCEHEEGGHSIHRDGFCEGPEVPLCCACGAHELPSCETLWAMIAARST